MSRVYSFPLILIAGVFSILFSLTLFLVNLKFVVAPGFIKARLEEVNIYQPAVLHLKNVWLKDLGYEETDGVNIALAESLEPEWLQGEIERNLNQLGDYFGDRNDELVLNLEIVPLKEEMINKLKVKDEKTVREIQESLPDSIDLFGEAGLLGEEGSRQLYQLKMTIEAVNLMIKITLFVLLFSLICFFFLRPIAEAWYLVGITLLASGLILALSVFILRVWVVVRLIPFLAEKIKFAPEMIEVSTRLIDKSLQSYLALIQWQSIFVLVLGLLIVMLTLIFKAKD